MQRPALDLERSALGICGSVKVRKVILSHGDSLPCRGARGAANHDVRANATNRVRFRIPLSLRRQGFRPTVFTLLYIGNIY